MSKTFDLAPVFGPAVSVRNYNSVSGSGSFRPAARRSARSRGFLGFFSKFWTSSAALGSVSGYALLFLFGATIVSYVFLVNSSAAKGYEMKKIQNSLQEQSEIRHSLEIKTSELSSLGAIDQAAASASLVSITNEEFLTPTTITALKTSK
jgi:hypothetical protein